MIGTGRAAIFDREEQDSDVEDRPERLKRDKDPVIDEERMSEEEDRCGEPDEIRVNAEPGRAPLSKQMDNLRHIANKAERDASKPQELRGVQVHGEAARRCPHHSSFPMVIGRSRSSLPFGGAMWTSSSATAYDGDGGRRVTHFSTVRRCGGRLVPGARTGRVNDSHRAAATTRSFGSTFWAGPTSLGMDGWSSTSGATRS